MMKVILALSGLMLTLFNGSAQKPSARFAVPPGHHEAPAVIRFENLSEKAESYLWTFGDGTESNEPTPEHRYGQAGTYDVTLTAFAGKKSDSMTQTVQIDPPSKCLIEITTDHGVMIAELYDATPKHRDNFLKLAEEGYYNDLLFHRVIDGFMIQGGDPNSRGAAAGTPLGSGGPGYQVDAEFVDSLVHIRGAIAAARTGDNVNPQRKSSGSQFYIVHGSPVDNTTLDQLEQRKGVTYTPAQREAYIQQGGTPFLDRDYTVFGRVISGLEVIDKIAAAEKDGRDRPKQDVKMTVRVIR